MGESSARPARLRHFRTTADAIAEGVVRRAGDAESALDGYVGGQESTYRVDVGPILEAVSALAATLRSLGVWVGDVGDAFAAVDDGDLDDTHSLDDATIIANLPPDRRADPFREDEALTPELIGWDPSSGAEPPPWLDPLKGVDTAFDWTEPALAAAVGHYLQRVSGYTRASGVVVPSYVRYDPRYGGKALLGPFAAASELDSFSRWVGRAGVAVSFASGTAGQWFSDDGMDTGERVLRATTMGTATAAGSGLGAWGGAAGGGAACLAGVVTAPAAPFCAIGGGIIGGIGGGAIGSWVADQLPWMDDPDPAERDHGDLADEIASFDEDPVDEMVPQVDGAAGAESARRQEPFDGVLGYIDPDVLRERYPDGPREPTHELSDEQIQEIIDYVESQD